MKQGTLIIIVVVILMAIGLIFYFNSPKPNIAEVSTVAPNSTGSSSLVPVVMGTQAPKKKSIWDQIRDLFKRKDKVFVQTPPIDADGIDARGYNAQGFYMRPPSYDDDIDFRGYDSDGFFRG